MLAAYFGGHGFWSYGKTENEIDQLTYEIRAKKSIHPIKISIEPERSFTLPELENLRSEVRLRNQIILGDYFQWSKVLHELEILLPSTLFLNDLDANQENKELKLAGYAGSFGDIVRFITNLENSGFFNNTFLLNQNIKETQSGEKQLEFLITTNINYAIPDIKHMNMDREETGNDTTPKITEKRRPFSLQVASFKKKDDAIQLYKRLSGEHEIVFLNKVELCGIGQRYRVFVGAFKDKESAEDYLSNHGKNHSWLILATPYAIELGSYKSLREAKEKIIQLESAGFYPYILKAKRDGQQEVFRVIVGAFSKDQANVTLKWLNEDKITGERVYR